MLVQPFETHLMLTISGFHLHPLFTCNKITHSYWQNFRAFVENFKKLPVIFKANNNKKHDQKIPIGERNFMLEKLDFIGYRV